jgi:hypothetical protein
VAAVGTLLPRVAPARPKPLKHFLRDFDDPLRSPQRGHHDHGRHHLHGRRGSHCCRKHCHGGGAPQRPRWERCCQGSPQPGPSRLNTFYVILMILYVLLHTTSTAGGEAIAAVSIATGAALLNEDLLTANLVGVTLARFGKLKYFDVSRPKNCAFVEFNEPSGYTAAVAANPHQRSLYKQGRSPQHGAATSCGHRRRSAIRLRWKGSPAPRTAPLLNSTSPLVIPLPLPPTPTRLAVSRSSLRPGWGDPWQQRSHRGHGE